jgi:peptidoglycan/LPS O-acetylase OafA/YrhL
MTQPDAAQTQLLEELTKLLRTGADRDKPQAGRLHYLDWLQALVILGIFLFHALHPFDTLADWMVKNGQTTAVLNLLGGFVYPWGMPLLFTLSGAASWFSLQGRTPGRYLVERVTRLGIPYFVGVILLSPIQAYIELLHKGSWPGGSFFVFLRSPEARAYWAERLATGVGPRLLNRLGYHLWFVGFLFVFSVIALPVLLWLSKGAGKRLVGWLAGLAERPGGLLVFAVPLVLVRWLLQRNVLGDDYDWADFVYYMLFFLSGFILYADERFARAIRRDGRLHLLLSIPCTLYLFSSAAGVPVWEWLGSPGTPGFYLSWILWGINSWCWTTVVFRMGMRRLNYTNKWLCYARQASYPFFFLHQPAILLVAFYVVRWPVPLPIKLLAVVAGSFVLSLAVYELLVRCLNPVQFLFGMGLKRKARAAPPQS